MLFCLLVLSCGSPAVPQTSLGPTGTPAAAEATRIPIPSPTFQPTQTSEPTQMPEPTPSPQSTPTPGPPEFSHAKTVLQQTDATDHLGPDGYPWARSRPLLIDKAGKLLVWAQKATGKGDGPVRPVVSS